MFKMTKTWEKNSKKCQKVPKSSNKGKKVTKKKCMKLLKTDKWGKKFKKNPANSKKVPKGAKKY
jgi:hypothetical protein